MTANAPLEVDNNRIYLTATVGRPGGFGLTLRCWLDSGGGSLTLSEATARRLGYTVPAGTADGSYVPIALPSIAFGSAVIDSYPETLAYIQVGPSSEDLMGESDAFLPLGLFRKYACAIDYAKGVLSLDPPPVSGPRIPVQISQSRGFPRIIADIGGFSVAFLLDTGAACSMLSRAVVDDLSNSHPTWRRVSGAYGAANMIGGSTDAGSVMLRIPSVMIGSESYQDLVVVARRAGIFEQNMSRFMSAPIVGALGGDFLKRFVLCIDFPKSDVVFGSYRYSADDDWNMIPLCLTAERDGPTVARVGSMADAALRANVEPGDTLLTIDRERVEGVSLQKSLLLLRGSAGTTHELGFRREGRSFSVITTVVTII